MNRKQNTWEAINLVYQWRSFYLPYCFPLPAYMKRVLKLLQRIASESTLPRASSQPFSLYPPISSTTLPYAIKSPRFGITLHTVNKNAGARIILGVIVRMFASERTGHSIWDSASVR